MAATKRTPAQIRKAETAIRRARFAQQLQHDPEIRAIFSSLFVPLKPLLEEAPEIPDVDILEFVGKGVEHIPSEGEQPRM